MGLFDKKVCSICGGPIGLLGNRKLADGNMCKDCASKMSPLVTDRKEYTVAEMMDHLNYREANQINLQAFRTACTIGTNYKLYVDATNMLWFVTRSDNYLKTNPDIFAFNQITGCNVDLRQRTHEVYYDGPDGRRMSYNPPEYDYDYDFYVTVYLNAFVPSIEMRLNTFTIDDDLSPEFRQCEADANAMKSLFDQMMMCVPQLNIPGQLVMNSAMLADLERQRIERNRLRDIRRRPPHLATIGGAIPVVTAAPHHTTTTHVTAPHPAPHSNTIAGGKPTPPPAKSVPGHSPSIGSGRPAPQPAKSVPGHSPSIGSGRPTPPPAKSVPGHGPNKPTLGGHR